MMKPTTASNPTKLGPVQTQRLENVLDAPQRIPGGNALELFPIK